jgi:hypothetical protein
LIKIKRAAIIMIPRVAYIKKLLKPGVFPPPASTTLGPVEGSGELKVVREVVEELEAEEVAILIDVELVWYRELVVSIEVFLTSV